MKTEKQTKIENILKENTKFLCDNIDIGYLYEDGKTREELEESIQDYIMESVSVTYYATAIDFLKENDPSLRESMEELQQYGTELKNINSELLASVLLQKYCSEEISDFLDACEAEGIFEENAEE